jgi:hypothetical protein
VIRGRVADECDLHEAFADAEGDTMAVIAHIVIEGVTKDQYDAVRAKVGWLEEPPTGGIAHLTWWEGAACHNIDAWQSEDALNRFAEQHLGPALAAVGIASAPQVTVHGAHEVYAPEAVKLTAT